MEVPRRPPVQRSRLLLLLQPLKSQFSVSHRPHLPLDQLQRTELVVRTMATLSAETGHRAVVAQHTVSVVTPLLTAVMDAKADLALALLLLLPQGLRQLQQTQMEVPLRLSVRLVFQLCTLVSCQTARSSSWTKSRTILKSNFPTASSLTLQNTTQQRTQWLGLDTRFVLVHFYFVLR